MATKPHENSDMVDNNATTTEADFHRFGDGLTDPNTGWFYYRCPCCGYPTLGGRRGYEICRLCWWEDDGQDDPHADEVTGGPNGRFSLTEARENFKNHWVMYTPENDRRIHKGNTDLELVAKKATVEAFNEMLSAPDGRCAELWKVVLDAKRTLGKELTRQIWDIETHRSDNAAT